MGPLSATDFHVLMVLAEGPSYGYAIMKAVHEHSDGGVSPDELVSLYRRAAALVFPSLYEGFGLPPLEAMACGCPVAVSNAGSLPEVVGDAAVLFDPYDTSAIAWAIGEALERSAELAPRGVARASGFTWDATARAHDRVYELAAGAA